MPPLPPVPDAVKVACSGNIGGVPFTNVFHMAAGVPVVVSDTTELAVKVNTAYVTYLFPYLSSLVHGLTTTVEDLSASPVLPGAAGSSAVGAQGAGTPGSNMCILVKHIIARRYRGGHPRTYLPPSEANQLANSNQWGPTFVANMQTAYVNFGSACTTALGTSGHTYDFVNISYFSSHALRVTPVVDVIVSSTVESMVATQRRRIGR